jgi:hypothetical protein
MTLPADAPAKTLEPWQDPSHPDYHWHGCMQILRDMALLPSPMKLASPRALPPKKAHRLRIILERGFAAGPFLAARRDLDERGVAHWIARFDEPALLELAARHGCVDLLGAKRPRRAELFHPAAEAAQHGSAAGLSVFLDREPNLLCLPALHWNGGEPSGLLWLACLNRNEDTVGELLRRGARPDGLADGLAPLLAMAYSKPDCQATSNIARQLIRAGADPRLPLRQAPGRISNPPQRAYAHSLAAQEAMAAWENARLSEEAPLAPRGPRLTL